MPRARSLVFALAPALALASACNQAFGLEATQSVDARYFDAPPPVCPAIGSPPAFSDDLHQVLLQNCTDYTVSANGRALARCSGVISEGPADGPLTPSPGFAPLPNTLYLSPRIGPDGDTAVIRVSDKTTSTARVYFATFARGDAGAWSKTGEFDLMNASSSSSPSRNGRILAMGSSGIHEFADNGNGTWTDLGVHTDFGVSVLSEGVAITGDGLRALFIGQPPAGGPTSMLYADRASIDAPFSQAIVMPSVEYFPNGFLTEDCARLYTWALGTVFYVTPP